MDRNEEIMRLDVSPTRMELLQLKKRHTIAKRGHKLLKDKLDELIRIMLLRVKEFKELKKGINKSLEEVNRYMTLASHSVFPEALTGALMTSDRKPAIRVVYSQLLNLNVPKFIVESAQPVRNYGFVQTSEGLDHALVIFDPVLKDLIALSQHEKTILLIADEIRKTKRRVNALEYILIPNMKETINFITMKLNEQERNRQTQLMRIKEVLRAPKAPTSAYPGVGKFPL